MAKQVGGAAVAERPRQVAKVADAGQFDAPVRRAVTLEDLAMGKFPRTPLVDESDLYVLFRGHGSGRLPFLLAWINRHRLTSGYSENHAARFGRVLVIGQPDGLSLPERCDASFVRLDDADLLFRTSPSVQSFFGRGHGD